MRRTVSVLVAIGVMALIGTTNAMAAKSSSSSITLQLLSAPTGAAAPSTVPFGSEATYNVSTKATNFPWVETLCFQSGKLVLGQTVGFFSTYYTAPVITLGPTPSWSEGSATCTATLFSYDSGKRHDLASMSFTVA